MAGVKNLKRLPGVFVHRGVSYYPSFWKFGKKIQMCPGAPPMQVNKLFAQNLHEVKNIGLDFEYG